MSCEEVDPAQVYIFDPLLKSERDKLIVADCFYTSHVWFLTSRLDFHIKLFAKETVRKVCLKPRLWSMVGALSG